MTRFACNDIEMLLTFLFMYFCSRFHCVTNIHMCPHISFPQTNILLHCGNISCLIFITSKTVHSLCSVQVDNRVSSHGTSAPLLPILHRFGAVPPLKTPSSSPPLWDDNMPMEVCDRGILSMFT